jgi:glycosyltransferase involved in cell wall biosynthesis
VDPATVDRWQSDLMQEAAGTTGVSVMPYIDNGELLRRLSGYDLLVMPSRHDGWGAAVNEALMAGIPALVSGRCGSATLLEGRPFLGEVTEPDALFLAARLDDFVERGRPCAARRRAIREWALQHISGKALAEHFLAIAGGHTPRREGPVAAPWERDTAIETGITAAAAT